MKTLFNTIIILLLSLTIKASDADMVNIRDLYYRASSSRSDAELFFKTMQANPSIKKSLADGYKGMSYMIKANFDFNPYYKLSFFVKGKGLLDDAIESDNKNIELRFLRFCVQTNAPGFLGYSGKIALDKKEILGNFKSIEDVDLRKRIKEFMLNSKYCSNEEKQVLK